MFSELLYRKYLFLLKESPRHSQTIHQDSTHQQNIENLLYLNQRSVGVGTASVKMGYFLDKKIFMDGVQWLIRKWSRQEDIAGISLNAERAIRGEVSELRQQKSGVSYNAILAQPLLDDGIVRIHLLLIREMRHGELVLGFQISAGAGHSHHDIMLWGQRQLMVVGDELLSADSMVVGNIRTQEATGHENE